MPNPVTFKFRYALLTYAQCGDLDPWAIVDMLAELRAECIIGREPHADGGIHLHCFADFGRTFRSRRADIFDVQGRHPNVRHVGKTPELVFDYAIKEGDVVAGGAERPTEHRSALAGQDAIWHKIAGAETQEEFFQLCGDLAPRSLCINFNSLQSFAAWRYRVDRAEYRHPDGVSFAQDKVAELDAWAQGNVGRTGQGMFSLPTLRSGGAPQKELWPSFLWALRAGGLIERGGPYPSLTAST